MKRYLNFTRKGIQVSKRPTIRHWTIEVDLPDGTNEISVAIAVVQKAEKDHLIVWENVGLFEGDNEFQWVLSGRGRELLFGK